MPDSRRSSVDLPAPLCPTKPTRSPFSRDKVMSLSASITTTLDVLRPMVPPALPRNAFFSDRDLASKMGNSTHALRVETWGRGDEDEVTATGTGRFRSGGQDPRADLACRRLGAVRP